MMLLNCFIFLGAAGTASAEATVETAVQAVPATVSAGSAANFNATVTFSETSSLLLDLEIFDASLKKVHQVFVDNIQVSAGVAKTVPFTWNVPTNLPEGSYSVSLGVFGAGWSGMYKWHAGAAMLNVTSGAPTLSITSSALASPETVNPGSQVAVSTTVTASVYTKALVEVSLVQPDGGKVQTQSFLHTFQAAQPKAFDITWNVPQNAVQGAYRIDVGVFKQDRSETLHSNPAAGQFNVASKAQLPAPANLKAEPQEKAIALTWNAVAGAAEYEVEADGAVIGKVTSTSYVHTGLLPETEHTYRVRAMNTSASGVWSATVKAKTLPAPVSTNKIKVSVEASDTVTTGQPTPGIEIVNVSTAPVALRDVSARYYFTIDGEKALNIGFWTTTNKDTVIAKFVKMPIPSQYADHYLEISFKDTAATLQPGAKVGVYTWINKIDWSNFDQSNDYSYVKAAGPIDNEKATGYVAGKLNWGTEPELFNMPPFPEGITAVPTNTSITVSWAAVEGATGYEVRADGSIIENISGTAYKHDWLGSGTRHTYEVRARKGNAVSIWSSPLTLKTTGEQNLPAPVNMRAVAADTAITVTWNAVTEEITGYDIEVDGKVISNAMSTSYVHSGLASGSKHTYRVRSKDGTTLGIWSSLITAQTPRVITGPFDVNFTVDTSAERVPISPYIYGTNEELTGTENWTSRRMGGNRLSTYNWENNASNAGEDYFHMSDNYIPWYYGGVPWGGNMDEPGVGLAGFHQKSLAKNAYTLTTLQTAGYVAKDKNGAVSSAETAPSNRWAEVKPAKNAPFSLQPDLNDNAVYMDEFVNLMVSKFGNASTATGIKGYQIDNEPGLWHSTHPYMHPVKPGAAEVANKGIELAKAVKKVDPYAEMYGPVSYGFDEMYNMREAADWNSVKGNYDWYLDYYLDKFRVASLQENRRLLDALDVHWYPEVTGGGYRITDSRSNSNLEANKARMQAPRSLWDPTYTENTWIGQWYNSYLPLIPRMQQSINMYNPGTKIAITEYNYGGENNVYGGIANADVLGIFGKNGVYMANFWKMFNELKEAPYITAAFKLFTNYDGNNSKFGDTKVKAETSDIENSSIYGSVFKDNNNNLHLIVLNKNNDFDMNAVFNLAGGTNYTSARVFAFDSSSSTITERVPVTNITNNAFTYTVPKLTACHIVLSTGN
jgi:hypothetical protein